MPRSAPWIRSQSKQKGRRWASGENLPRARPFSLADLPALSPRASLYWHRPCLIYESMASSLSSEPSVVASPKHIPVKGFLDSPIRWVVLANRASAAIYWDDRKFHFVDRLTDNKARRPEADLVTDRPGRGGSSAAGSIRHAYEGEVSQHEREAHKFAKGIAHYLSEAHRQKRVGEIILAAEPHFLGVLRRELDTATRAAVIFEIPHEYTYGSEEELRERVHHALDQSKIGTLI